MSCLFDIHVKYSSCYYVIMLLAFGVCPLLHYTKGNPGQLFGVIESELNFSPVGVISYYLVLQF